MSVDSPKLEICAAAFKIAKFFAKHMRYHINSQLFSYEFKR